MRLGTLVSDAADIYEAIEGIEYSNEKEGATTYTTVKNWVNAYDMLMLPTLSTYAFTEIESILDMGPHLQARNRALVLNQPDLSALKRNLNIIQHKCFAITSALRDFTHSSQDVLNIKLPPLDDLNELSSSSHRLEISFTQCPIFDNNLELKLAGVEPGSIWLFVKIITGTIAVPQALKMIADFVKVCLECRHLFYQTEDIKLDIAIKKAKMNPQIAADFKKAYQEEAREALRAECVNRCKAIAPDKNFTNEEINRLVESMKTLSSLLDKGLEIYASDDVDNETERAFPTEEDYQRLPSGPKFLGETHDEQEEG